MPPAPMLMEGLLEEFLLGLPPEDPATLVRAALVCKRWYRLISSPGFRRRFREFHRTPPMLGLCYVTNDDGKLEARVPATFPFVLPIQGFCNFTRDDGKHEAHFADTTSFGLPRDIPRYWRPLDSRHGRVLLHSATREGIHFVIWDPITDEKQELPIPPGLQKLRRVATWSGAVFCAAVGKCDHLDCQSGPFSVFFGFTARSDVQVYVYSSEVGAWSKVSPLKPGKNFLMTQCARGALVGNALYFPCLANASILKYDVAMWEISLIDGPLVWSEFDGHSVLMATEDGRLGIAYVVEFKLLIWSCEVGPNSRARWSRSRVVELATLAPFLTLYDDTDARSSFTSVIDEVTLAPFLTLPNRSERWSLSTVIDLATLALFGSLTCSPNAIGYADGIGLMFLQTLDGLFTIDLKSGHVRKMSEDHDISHSVFPFMSFYTPALGMASTANIPVSSTQTT